MRAHNSFKNLLFSIELHIAVAKCSVDLLLSRLPSASSNTIVYGFFLKNDLQLLEDCPIPNIQNVFAND